MRVIQEGKIKERKCSRGRKEGRKEGKVRGIRGGRRKRRKEEERQHKCINGSGRQENVCLKR